LSPDVILIHVILTATKQKGHSVLAPDWDSRGGERHSTFDARVPKSPSQKNHCGVGDGYFFLTSLLIRSMLTRHHTGRQHRVHKTLRELLDLRRNQIETALFCSSFSSDAMCMW
jgi:hypothetical protein